MAAKTASREGKDITAAISEVKRLSSFNDKRNQMRPNLYALLEHWGIDRWLGLASGAALFEDGWDLVQTWADENQPLYAGLLLKKWYNLYST